MVENKKTKRQRDIKAKLMAAIAMLLVSSIMMVSTTYAWFTLSTAPEVTGIQTAVGANGNLEMALLPSDGSLPAESAVGDATKDVMLRNITWGNLVDVSDARYGMNMIVLNPAQLTVDVEDENGNPTQINKQNYVAYPEYGNDGRVSELSKNAVTAVYDTTDGFVPSTESQYGVRAVGVASGMTDRQLAYRNARGNANTAMSQAKNEAKKSLDKNGNALANVAVKKATNNEGGYVKSDVEAMRGIVTSLTEKVLPQIEKAYAQYILAYAASAKTSDNGAWLAIKAKIDGGASLLGTDGLLVETDGAYSLNVAGVTVELPTELNEPIAKLAETKAKVASADSELEALEATLESDPKATFNWNQISGILTDLANPDSMKVNGKAPSEIKANLSSFAQDVMKNGLVVTMHTGGGVYADVADHCGNYEASVTIEKIEYGGMEFEDMTARMKTESSVTTAYLTGLGTVVTGAGSPSSEGAEAKPMSETYAYIIDLAFRTNAANSNLLLQADATDRIYSDNTNEETMGHGATMTFKAVSPDFTDDNVKELMANIKIVFFDPDSGKVYALAKLDAANATTDTEGTTAEMYIYSIGYGANVVDGFYGKATTEEVTGADDVVTTTVTTEYYKSATDTTVVMTSVSVKVGDADATVTYYEGAVADNKVIEQAAAEALRVKADTTEIKSTDNKIMTLPQNQGVKVSVLVYLDGETITNADVAYNAAQSVTGTMNLQFASSADLMPMEYGNLHITDATEGN